MKEKPGSGEAAENKKEPMAIKNRDIPLLCDTLGVMQLVNTSERRLDWQHDRMLSITQHISGMPGGGVLTKGLEDAFSMLEEAGETHGEQIRQYAYELKKVERVLNSIESRTMRAFVILKYVMDTPDAEIRRELNMTEWGFNRARKSIEEAESMADVVWREKYILADQK